MSKMIYDPLDDGISMIELIDHMGGDLAIVNDARASFERESPELLPKDEKLIKYLITHQHTSPLRSTVFKFKVKAPLYICRQWWKHCLASNHNEEQLGWNEKCISGRQEIKSWWGKTFTMADIFDLYNKGRAPYLRSMAPDGTIVKGKINNVWSTGTNKVYRVTSELGYTIDSTMSHRYCTPTGYKTLAELKVGDEVMMNGIPAYRDKQWLIDNYIETDNTLNDVSELCGASTHTLRKWLSKYDLHLTRLEVSRRSILKHGVYGKGETKETNPKLAERGRKTGLAQKGKPKGFKGELHHAYKGDDATVNAGHYRARKLVTKTKCQFCEATENLEVHHVDGNPLNNDLSNLEVVCHNHHKMRHGKQVLVKAHPVKIKSIEFLCEEETFDIEMQENHNFVANQFIVHNSFRYVAIEDGNEFYVPESFRRQSKDNKQATEGKLSDTDNIAAKELYRQQCVDSYNTYSQLLALGVGREQARGVLVPSVYTSWVWTVSLQSTLNFVGLRLGKGAQSEIGAYAMAIKELIEPIVPVAMEAWLDNQ